MSELPKPAFSTEEERIAGAEALAKTDDTTTDVVEQAVQMGELVWDSNLAHVRYLKKDDEVLYHVFRGPNVPERFWGTGEFGLCLLTAAETTWNFDKPKVEFMQESCRQEVYEDDPRKAPKFPPHFYSAYLVAVPGMNRRLMVPEDKIKGLCDLLEQELKEAIAKWSNGGS